MHQVATPPPVVRALTAADLADVIAIDSALEGRSRRGYAERRLAAARRDPALHAQFAAVDEHGLAGYILARMLEGEFGSQARSMRIELVGVRRRHPWPRRGPKIVRRALAMGRPPRRDRTAHAVRLVRRGDAALAGRHGLRAGAGAGASNAPSPAATTAPSATTLSRWRLATAPPTRCVSMAPAPATTSSAWPATVPTCAR